MRKLVPPSSPEWEKTRVTCIVGDPSFSSCLVSSLDAQRIVLTGPPSQTRLKYVLGPLIADGGDVARAASIPGQPPGSDWEVAIRLTPEASTTFFAATARAVLAQYPRNVIAIIVRGQIVSAPQVQAAVMRGYIDIRGGFTRREAEALAASLSPGGGP